MKQEFELNVDEYLIRSMRLDDADTLVKWRSKEELIQYFYDPTPLTMENHLNWYHRIYINDITQYHFLILSDDVPVGFVNLLHIDYENKSCEIGYAICENAFLKKGIASKSIQKLMEFAKDKWNISKFYAGIHKENRESIHFIRRLGFCESNIVDNNFRIYEKIFDLQL